MDLLDLLRQWNEATTELLECRAAFADTDTDYFCADKDVAVHVARELFFRELYRLFDDHHARR